MIHKEIIGNATIYLGSSVDILSELKAAEAIVTDPPYGLPGEDIDEVMLILKSLSPDALAAFSDWRYSHLIGSLERKVGELAWEYGWVSGGRAKAKCGVLPTHNTIHLFGEKERFRFTAGTMIRRGPGLSSPRQCSFAAKSGHPHEKPVELMKLLLNGIQADEICDPFMGSGTTGVAAISLGKRFIGVEIETKWYEVARNRITEAQKQERLFA